MDKLLSQQKSNHKPLRNSSSASIFMSFHLLWSLFDREILWTITTGGHSIRSSFRAKASGLGNTSGIQVPDGSGMVFHPIRTQIALWRPKCCGLNPVLWDMKAWLAKAFVFINSFDALKEETWVRIATSFLHNKLQKVYPYVLLHIGNDKKNICTKKQLPMLYSFTVLQ